MFRRVPIPSLENHTSNFPPTLMNDVEQLQLIVEFLRSLDADAFTRSEEPLPPELETRLGDLASGRLEPAEVRRVLVEIAQNRNAVSRLADLLKERNPEPSSET